jgi:CRISPR/Cas system endoribonuclease Cas6 (RAMP superfamily)
MKIETIVLFWVIGIAIVASIPILIYRHRQLAKSWNKEKEELQQENVRITKDLELNQLYISLLEQLHGVSKHSIQQKPWTIPTITIHLQGGSIQPQLYTQIEGIWRGS